MSERRISAGPARGSGHHRKLAAIPADQEWFWTERWQQMEREADGAIAAGQVKVTEGVDELLAELDS